MLPVGTIVNVLAVLAGGAVGLLAGNRLPARVRTVVFQALGLCTLGIGVTMILGMRNPLVVIFSVVGGAVCGEVLRLEARLEGLSERLKARLRSKNELFTDGLVTAFLLFCVGSMTILGAFDEGLRGDPTLLFTKSLLDGLAAVALAATCGLGVLFSVIPLFLYQYGLTLFAGLLHSVFTEPMIAQLTATGGVLILGIGLTLLDIKRIALTNFLPALPLCVLLSLWF
jgi:uncharacterized membrane protein YqgA involved in biofilm formation